MKIQIRHCNQADEEHRKSRRQYAHTHHVNRTICVADDFYNLPEDHQKGIVAHEIGHLIRGTRKHSEREADNAVLDRYGVKVRYRDSRHGKRLQYV